MTLWRYEAVSLNGSSPAGGAAGTRRGEITAPSAADARGALRSAGMRVLALDPVAPGLLDRLRDIMPVNRHGHDGDAATARPLPVASTLRRAVHGLTAALQRRQRARRAPARAEYHDALATMLGTGLPVIEALRTLAREVGTARELRRMLRRLADRLGDGGSLTAAMRTQPDWFGPLDIAMVEAAEHAGTLPETLRTLADRQARHGELTQRLVGALTYPAVVALVGCGVALFLSVQTLPQLMGLLERSEIAPPPLSVAVMEIGQWTVSNGLLLAALLGAALIGVPIVAPRLIALLPDRARRFAGRMAPPAWRAARLARVSGQLALLMRSGVPMVDGLRLLAPTVGGALGSALDTAAARVESGEDLVHALDDDAHFSGEFRQLLAVGIASGELDVLLDRLADRLERRARRLIDRLAGLLEPAAVLLLAGLVGVVVFATLMPLMKLREIIT